MTLPAQDDLSKQRRLNKGCCPVHGLRLVPGEVLVDATVFDCPRTDCEFTIVPKHGTKCYASLYPRLVKAK